MLYISYLMYYLVNYFLITKWHCDCENYDTTKISCSLCKKFCALLLPEIYSFNFLLLVGQRENNWPSGKLGKFCFVCICLQVLLRMLLRHSLQTCSVHLCIQSQY